MKIEKLPSGSYRIRKMVNGRSISLVFDHKPTQIEIVQRMADAMDDAPSGSFLEYANRYVSAKANILSPSTIKAYRSIIRSISENFKKCQLAQITDEMVQVEINSYSVNHTAKTVGNFYGFIASVLGMYRPRLNLHVTLPQKKKSETYVPTDEEVRQVLEYSKGTAFECALWLAVYGLRRSEIIAITKDDLEGNKLTVNKAMVQGADKQWTIKTTKTTESTRSFFIPDYLADLIRTQGKAYTGHPGVILKDLHRTQDKLGIPRFKLHALRHYFASLMSEYFPEATVLYMGGWKTPAVMKEVYRRQRIDRDEEMQKKAANLIANTVSRK